MAEQNDISYLLRQRDAIEFFCEARKKRQRDVRDVTECVWDRSNEPNCSALMMEEF
jgi:hypothetical protein